MRYCNYFHADLSFFELETHTSCAIKLVDEFGWLTNGILEWWKLIFIGWSIKTVNFCNHITVDFFYQLNVELHSKLSLIILFFQKPDWTRPLQDLDHLSDNCFEKILKLVSAHFIQSRVDHHIKKHGCHRRSYIVIYENMIVMVSSIEVSDNMHIIKWS